MNIVLEANVIEEAGYKSAMEGLALNKKQTKDMKPVGLKLSKHDGGHNKFLEHMYIWVMVKAPRYWWQEADTVRISSKNSECYDYKTEVLTKDGWKFFKNVNKDDLFYTLNLKTKLPEYQLSTKIIESDYDGDMIHFKNRFNDFVITPNHKFIHTMKRTKELVLVKIEEVLNNKRQSLFFPKTLEILPPITSYCPESIKVCIKNTGMTISDFFLFCGLYISEGYIANKKAIVLCQTEKSNYYSLFKNFEKYTFFNRKHIDKKRGGVKWFFKDDKVLAFLRILGKSHDKYIPRVLLESSVDYLSKLEEGLMAGDGSIKYGKYVYTTVSDKLANDVQELFAKLGFNSNICYQERDSLFIYRVRRHSNRSTYLYKRDIKTIKYSGKVYCVTVPNHTLFVRRNGKVMWCGNSTMHTLLKEVNEGIQECDFEDIDQHGIDRLEEALGMEDKNKQLVAIKQRLPEGFLQKRMWCMSYKTLRNIILQRRTHRLPHWKMFIEQVLDQVDYPEFLPKLDPKEEK